MTHLPRGVGRALWAAKKCRPPTQSRGGFLPCESARYRISAANYRPVCPLQCIRPGSTSPSAHHARALPIDCCRLCVASLYRRRADGGVRAASPVSRNNLGGARRWSGAYPMRMCAAAHFEDMARYGAAGRTHFSRLSLHARDSCDSEALLPTRELLVQMIGEPPPARAPAQGRTHPGKPDAAPIPCVHLPILLANEMCKDHPAFRMVRSGARRQRPA